MLVLTRKLQQQIKIGEQITVTILRVKGNTVRVGIQAPREMRVIRGELPKNAAAAEITAPEVATIESADATMGEGAGETIEASEEAACMVDTAPREPRSAPTPVPLPSHLPLRRIRNRYGAAPLKQVIASCATLAK
jgi:carbon storage regulator